MEGGLDLSYEKNACAPVQPVTVSNLPSRQMTIARTGEALGISQDVSSAFQMSSVRMYREVLPPGRRSSSPHRHTKKEEIVYVLKGAVVALLGDQRLQMRAGQALGFPPHVETLHVIVNESVEDAEMLIVSNDPAEDHTLYG